MKQPLILAADAMERTAARIKRRAQRSQIVHKASLGELEARGWRDVPAVFFLSTGRCGTQLVTELLLAAGGTTPQHAPRPELVRASARAFEEIDTNPELFLEVFRSAREELVHEAYRYGTTYVETNNRITFFAPVIQRALPAARFVHLVRHPADVVRSGVRRNWYSGRHAHDVGRIAPRVNRDEWDGQDPIAKIGWMWEQTNAFIERFATGIDASRITRVRAEDLFGSVDEAARLLEFCGADPLPADRIAALIGRPVNAQRSGDFPRYEQWTDTQRNLLRAAAPLAGAYGYEL